MLMLESFFCAHRTFLAAEGRGESPVATGFVLHGWESLLINPTGEEDGCAG